MDVHVGLASAYPRSEALVKATRDLDRGRTTAEAVERLYRDGEATVAAEERRLAFESVTAGYLRDDDPFRRIARVWEGFAVGPLTRWLESNTFYRQPILLHPPSRRPGTYRASLPPPLLAEPGRSRIVAPGPYTFAGLLDNRSGETGPALVHRLGRLLAEEVRELVAGGHRTFVFSEPWLVVRPPDGPAAAAVEEAYRSIAAAADGRNVLLWTYGADAGPVLPLLDRLPVTAVGVDLTETEVDDLPVPDRPRPLGLGVVDPRTTLVEAPAEIARIVRAAAARRRATAVWLGPGAPLDLLPTGPAQGKPEALAEAARQLAAGGAS